MKKYNLEYDDIFDDMFYEFQQKYDFLKDNDGYKYQLPIEYYDIAKTFFDSVEKYLEENPDYKEEFEFDQIKTKFQWVRVYYHPTNSDIDGFIKKLYDSAEAFDKKREGILSIWMKKSV